MIIQLDWRFWICAIALFVLMRLELPIRRSSWFGLLNIIPLGALLGLRGLAFLVFFSVLLWIALALARRSEKGLNSGLTAYVIISGFVVGVLVTHKLAAEFLPIGSDPSFSQSMLRLLQLVAFSYVALRAWDAVESIRDGEPLLNPIGLCGYLAPFFMMPAGPINIYSEHIAIDRNAPSKLTPALYFDGVEMVVYGAFIKFCLADGLRLFSIGTNGQWPSSSLGWSSVIFIYIFLDFWGYSLVALGIGKLLGVPTPVNFDQPLRSRSLSEFWTRWHMSLGDFVKRRIYYPLQIAMMRRSGVERMHLVNTVSLISAFTFVGLWHRFTWPFVAWGVFFGIVLAIEKAISDELDPNFFERPWVNKLARLVGPIYTLVVVVGMLHLTAMPQMVK